jgi:hypothetical protein
LLLVDYLGLTVIRTSSVAMNTRKNSARRNRVSKVSDLGSHGCRRFGLDLLVASERLGATLDFDRGLASHLTYDRIQIVYIMKACERAGNPSRPLASISKITFAGGGPALFASSSEYALADRLLVKTHLDSWRRPPAPREDEFWATSRGPSDEVSSGWAESPPTMQTDASSRQLTRFPSSLRCGHPAMGWISRLLRHSVGGARGGLKVCAIRPSRPVWVVYGHESNFLQNKKPTRPVRLSRSAADLRPLLTQSGRLEAVPRAAPSVAYGARGLLDADGADQRSSTFRLSAAISIFP